MATVEKVERKIESYTVQLDRSEARALALVLQQVGGSPDHSARGYINKLESELTKAAFTKKELNDETDKLFKEHTGVGLYFHDNSRAFVEG